MGSSLPRHNQDNPEHLERSFDVRSPEYPGTPDNETAPESPKSGVFSREGLRLAMHEWLNAEKNRLATEEKVQRVLNGIDHEEEK